MQRIPPETIEQIQNTVDIVEVIEGYGVHLKRAAGVFKALCPFHNEKSASFTVDPKRQRFKCFGCGAGGTVFRFVMTYEQLDFVSAVKKMADRANIKIIEGEMSAEDAARYTLRRRLLALHAEAADFFHLQLMRKPSAQIARDYLKGRGVSVEVAKSWKLGYAPELSDAFSDFAHQRGFSAEEILQSGIVALRDADNPDAGFYDRFRNRLMFPICNDNNEVIAFSGRVLSAEQKGGKYVNSPETILFTKGAVLFGLNRSKRALINKSSAIVCEGQLDLITAFEAGIENVIAPQGTAFTDRQAHLLKRFVTEVVLCFDSDAAGENAAVKSLVHLLAENLVVRVAEMPPGEDPDSLIRSQGAAAFAQRIDEAKDFFDYQVDRLVNQPDFATPRGKQAAIKKIAGSISLLSDAILRETVVNRAAQRLEISPQEFVRILKKPPKAEPAPVTAAVPEPALVDPTLRLLALVTLCDDDARAWVFEEPWNEVLAREPDAGLLIKILSADFLPSNSSSVNAFLTTLDPGEEAALVGLLEIKPPSNALTIAHDCWKGLEKRQAQRRIEALTARMRNPQLSVEESVSLQKQILDLQIRLSHIARPFSLPL
ncbi:MAG: dnaG [Chthoniobacteraceae bacterium]|nr:dnaG [Chthoniobacteraceae bacterium]